jgi:general secretion pathway protein G
VNASTSLRIVLLALIIFVAELVVLRAVGPSVIRGGPDTIRVANHVALTILLLTAATVVLAPLAAWARMRRMRFIGLFAVTAVASALMSPAVGRGLGELVFWYTGHIKDSFPASRLQIEMLGTALDTFRTDVGRYPTTAEGLAALRQRPPNVDRWDGPYLKKGVPPDPWGRAFYYRSPGGGGRSYDLYSFGADGVPGGDGQDEDVASWDAVNP